MINKHNIMDNFNIQDYVTQPAANEAYSALVTDVKEVSELPDTLEPGKILVNSTGEDITLGGGSGSGTVTSFEEPKVFDSIEDMEELNNYDVKGALVSYNSATGKYTVWNGEADLDARAWDYRASDVDKASGTNSSLSGEWINRYANSWTQDVEFPTNTYGEVIAVCLGKGLWNYIKWDPTNEGNNYMWCNSESPLYNSMEVASLQPASGVASTAAMVAKVTAEVQSFFYDLTQAGKDDGTNGHLYVPNITELLDGKYNMGTVVGEDTVSHDFTNRLSHACGITGFYIWSSSQSDYYSGYAFNLDNNGSVYNYGKYNSYACLAFVRFGAALAAA